MELFWPEAEPDAARNNLNVVIYGLRQTLREADASFSHILFQDDCYLFNPQLALWLDVEAFNLRVQTAQKLEQQGDRKQASQEYAAAEMLYQGEFLEEDRYDEWLNPQRQVLQAAYLSLLEHLSQYYLDQHETSVAIATCRKMLGVDPSHEGAHRTLMQCYSAQGQQQLALRQYHLCTEALKRELDVSPSATTTDLDQRILAAPIPA
ncbi:MAG: hypothetical protein GXY36_00965 [Chloroflexi bacterium]|mgnify:CR=1 FL=1|nr:hypothetical protein [Chloroflexota bacterium]